LRREQPGAAGNRQQADAHLPAAVLAARGQHRDRGERVHRHEQQSGQVDGPGDPHRVRGGDRAEQQVAAARQSQGDPGPGQAGDLDALGGQEIAEPRHRASLTRSATPATAAVTAAQPQRTSSPCPRPADRSFTPGSSSRFRAALSGSSASRSGVAWIIVTANSTTVQTTPARLLRAATVTARPIREYVTAKARNRAWPRKVSPVTSSPGFQSLTAAYMNPTLTPAMTTATASTNR